MTTRTEDKYKQLNEAIALFPQIKPVDDTMVVAREGVHRLVMLDRYAFKDTQLRTLKVGDLVVVTTSPDPKYPRRGIGNVSAITEDGFKVTVKLEDEYGGEEMTFLRNEIDKPLEVFYEQIAHRNALNLASVEKTDEGKQYWFGKFYEQLSESKIVPAGRVIMGAGSGKLVTYFNCYVMPFPHDSRGGIADHRKVVMEIMSRGGGVGTNGSTLRPRNATCHGVDGKSSGSVSWLNDISSLTNLVEQGGSRRGAQMIMLNDNHPDIVEFIISKMQNPTILRRIINTIDDELIKREAQRKLKFTPLTPVERQQYEYILNMESKDGVVAVEQKAALDNAKQKLADGGHYDVHNPDFLTGANISVNISSELMDAVENDDSFALRFPAIDDYNAEMREVYNEKWHEVGDVREWEALGYETKTYYNIRAKDLWKLINLCATYAAEPGIFFIDNANDMTNAKAYGQKVVATNPCGEQPLAPWSVCNLAAINLSKFVVDGEVQWDMLKETVTIMTRLQDNVIDATPYFLEENTKQALGERRVGMGVMALADLLILAEKTYGSEDGNQLVDDVFRTIKEAAYRASIKLAEEKGSFPFLDVLSNGEVNVNGREKFANTGFMKKMPADIRNGVIQHGIRNSHLLTVAPTGTTGTMMNVATGLEPYFGHKYYRSGRLGQNIEVVSDLALAWLEKNGFDLNRPVDELIKELPAYFVSTMDLSPEAHVTVQCIIQNHVDSSISKTVNAPRGYSVAQVQEVYESLHAGGAKGGTVYVDGSRDTQVLSLTEDNTNDQTEYEEEVTPSVTAVVTEVSNIGGDVGNTCPVCKMGTLVDAGGCVTCNNCNAQTKCGL